MAVEAIRRGEVLRSLAVRTELGALHALGAIVAASFLFRAVAGWFRATPVYFADEYIYAELGRSIAETGRPLIRGTAANFPALLHPIVTAPAWLVENVELSFRLVQGLGALAMSLASIPVFLLARRLELGTKASLALALFAVALPDLLYASWVVAEPIAYPLALAAVLAGTGTLARPTPRSQLAFVALAGLATFARIQFVVLPVCFLAALVVVGVRERRLRRAARDQALALGLFGVAAVAVVATGPGRALGYYRVLLDVEVGVGALAEWIGLHGMLLAYASGWVLVPGAILGVALALWRPASRTELAFASLALFTTLALLFEGALYAASGGNRVQERYFFYAAPLIALAFVLYARRGWPLRLPHVLIAATLIALSTRLPLSGFAAAHGKTNSPFLIATGQLERAVGDVGLASLVIAVTAAVLSGVVILAMLRLRRPTPFVFGIALAGCLAVSVSVVVNDHRNTAQVRDIVFPREPSWVDATGVADAVLLQTPLGSRGFATEQLFWNRSIESVAVLPRTTPPDAFSVERAHIGDDGSLLVSGRPVTRPIVVEGYGTTVTFRGARTLASSAMYRLLAPDGRPQLALYMPGRYWDGWLAPDASVRVWPESGAAGLAGRLTFSVSVPDDADATTLFLHGPGEIYEVALSPGAERSVSVPVCADGEWQAEIEAPFTGTVGDRLVSVQTSKPVFRPDPAAC